ncbi:MAG: tetratricopeptide repeat protein, partial [Myxococcota bacterium]
VHLSTGDADNAEIMLRDHPDKPAKPDPDDAAWLAMIMAERGEHAKYLEQRRRHLVKLPARMGALVLCHLAEYCDQHMKMKGRVLALYREARTVDPQNTLASDALRGLGRGVKSWRSTSALLTEPGEESMSDPQRAARLFALGEQHRGNEPIQAMGWYERAVAVDPNLVAGWDALTEIGLERHDHEYAFITALEALFAYERTTKPGDAEEIAHHARRLASTARHARLADRDVEARALSTVAYAMDPNVPSAAILVADTRFEAGAIEAAGEMFGAIAEQLGDELDPKQRAHVLHRKARASLEAGDVEAAHDDLREALGSVPLFPPALDTMADVLRRQGHPVNAALHELKALLVTRDAERRGPICRRLGDLCDGELVRPGEAGAWYELAVEAGVEDKALMRRLLEHFRRTGRAQQALVAIGELIESTTDPMELADLWATRGSILAEHDLDAAEEALDIALSFNPAHPEALAYLRTVLEDRGDYEQLAALLDARTDTGSVEERADALRTLARMSFENLEDPERGEQYLERLVELAPSAEALEHLLSIVRGDPSRQAEQLPLLSRLMATGGPLCERIIEAAQLIYQSGQRHWTWAMLSALMGAAPIDPWTKSTLGELRREFERFDSLKLLHPYLIDTLGALPEPNPLQAALGDLCARVFLRTDEGAGSVVDGRTGPGRVFERVAEQLALEAKLIRSPDGSAPSGILSGDVLTVVVRTDLLAASPGELAYIYARSLMLARPACVALASVPEEDRPRLVRALHAAVDEASGPLDDPATAALSSAFAGKLSREELDVWKAHLDPIDAAEAKVAEAFAQVEESAMRMAAVAAGDSRTAIRAVARLTPDGKRPPGVARPEEFEAYFQSVPILSRLFAFIASDDFGRI